MNAADLTNEENTLFVAWVAEIESLCWNRDRTHIATLRSPESLLNAWRAGLGVKEMYWYASQAPRYR